jgi:RNA polymerase sigma factor (sigma-70 family)
MLSDLGGGMAAIVIGGNTKATWLGGHRGWPVTLIGWERPGLTLVLRAIVAGGISANRSDATPWRCTFAAVFRAIVHPTWRDPGFVQPTRSDSPATRLKRARPPGPPWIGAKGAYPMRNDPVVIDLVTRARNGEEQAWDALVERYAPLIWCICRRHRLGGADAEDVGQSVWVQVLDQLDKIRDPAALPGWLATTTQRECLRVLRAASAPIRAVQMLDAENIPDEHAETAGQELLVAERHAALREAFSHLPPNCQRLMAMLIADPPASYAEISARLGIPVGSIGPKRGRCLGKLRADPAIAALINAEAETAGHEIRSPALRWSGSVGASTFQVTP